MTRERGVRLQESWEFNVLEVYDFRRPGKLDGYFRFLGESLHLPGDVAEFGVYRGASLAATALFLHEAGSDKRVYGFDSFHGFPAYHAADDPQRFEELAARGAITEEHLDRVRRNRRYLEIVGRGSAPGAASSSGNFAGTSRELVERKLEFLRLDNVVLVEGPYEETLATDALSDVVFRAALVDCDLYGSHRAVLPFVWQRLAPGGLLFLDEYYSLKFPGARIAVDEFLDGRPERPERIDAAGDDFERWILRKQG